MAKINFIPNDPKAIADMNMRQQEPRSRPAGRAGFSLPTPAPKKGPAQPGTAAFLYWQCNEAVLATLDMWEQIDSPVTKWARSVSPKKLIVEVDAGSDLNAYYDGNSLSFFHFPVAGGDMYSAASTDVVSHECGHALLDCIRPDLWAINFVEAAAFHEAFGDCVALLTALHDKATRTKLLSISPKLTKKSFVEAVAEDLSSAVKASQGASHPAAAPRRALNKFKWALPETLPEVGPPNVLSSEVHSFGRIFVGCFYDLIQVLFDKCATANEAALWKAAETAGKLLIEGTKNAPVEPRFFRAVGRGMLIADDRLFGGKNKSLIREAFDGHNVTLGSPAAISPTAGLAGPAPKKKGKGLVVAPRTMSAIRASVGWSTFGLTTRSLSLGQSKVSEVSTIRPIPLDSLSKDLKGVVADGHEAVIVSGSNHRAALVGNPPLESATRDEVLTFVGLLLKFNRLDYGKNKKRKKPARKSAIKGEAANVPASRLPTHRLAARGKKLTVERVRFSCGCGLPGLVCD